MIIEAGTVIVFENGAYSSWSIIGPLKVLKTFDQLEKCKEYVKEFYETAEEYDDPSPDGFVAWLTKNGLVEDIEHKRWDLGDYSFEPRVDGKKYSVIDLFEGETI